MLKGVVLAKWKFVFFEEKSSELLCFSVSLLTLA